ncbi:PfkB family carbohydrate kinase [Dyadobacter sp. CY312]|uniref:PfkB family carbohydrate kinase n=1 Tax=Dyadobacter sp. CY312 TaxID=2907303 RepID=UPI001F1F0FD4|nr:PfkB family carbohydrate kinase [Dyadobacter sp. CY312]MCE7040258.1 PfkB family carbohydrate kinase [Dyadobacter sp. CY312]
MLVVNTHQKSGYSKEHLLEELNSKKITLGFDGYIDSIVKIVKTKGADGVEHYFEDSTEFGSYIIDKADKNFSLELHQEIFKVGGNMPITANAFARLGCKVDCIGALGLPDIHHIFEQQMSANCTFHSYAEPGMSTAIEFRNNKMMLAESTQINNADWSYIKETIGLELLIKLFSGKDLIGLLNWSELAHSSDVWRGLLTEVLPFSSQIQSKPIGLFDLSDCSKKTNVELLEALELIRRFGDYWNVVLSLNMNESTWIYKALYKGHTPRIEETAKAIHDATGIHTVLIHHSTTACCCNADGIVTKETQKISNPKLLTGAGDNFNTGFCAALLLGMTPAEALEMGHEVTRNYISTGQSPQLEHVLQKR